MGMFIPQLERILRVIVIMAVVSAIVVPVGWGYEQRQQARTWQETACAYRLREVTRGTGVVVSPERRASACAILRDLGIDIDAKP